MRLIWRIKIVWISYRDWIISLFLIESTIHRGNHCDNYLKGIVDSKKKENETFTIRYWIIYKRYGKIMSTFFFFSQLYSNIKNEPLNKISIFFFLIPTLLVNSRDSRDGRFFLLPKRTAEISLFLWLIRRERVLYG